MRITNKDYTPLEVLAELLAYRPTSKADTSRFAERDLSNHDFLVEELRERLEAILDSFERLGSESCEMQGLDDKGVDVLMRFERNGKPYRIGFQIKSNREAELDRARSIKADKSASSQTTDPESSLLKTLKRQAHEARLETQVNEWWVLPCFNLKGHQRRLAGINTHFNHHPDPAWPIRVVSPEQILGLLSMSIADVDAICTRLLCRDDEVLKAARLEYGQLSHAAQSFLNATFGDALQGETAVDEQAFADAAREADEHVDEMQLRDELQALDYVVRDFRMDMLRLDAHAFPGLCALYFEGRVRHSLNSSRAEAFVWRLLDDVAPPGSDLDDDDD